MRFPTKWLGRVSQSLATGIVASLIVSCLAYYLLRDNITSLIDRGLEILAINETIDDLERLAGLPSDVAAPGSQPVHPADLALKELASLSKSVEAGLEHIDRIAEALEKLPIETGPRAVFDETLVADPKQTILLELKDVRQGLADQRLRIRDIASGVRDAQAAADEEYATAVRNADWSVQRMKHEIRRVSLALRARRDTMLQVLQEFGRDR